MPSFLSLPHELRQEIIGYAFEDAIEADVRLNLWMRINLRTCIDCMALELFRLIDSGPHKITEGQPIDRKATLYAPNINYVASTIRLVHPQLAEDMLYVLNKSLDCMGTQYDDESPEIWRDWWRKNEQTAIRPKWLSQKKEDWQQAWTWIDPRSEHHNYHLLTTTGVANHVDWPVRAF